MSPPDLAIIVASQGTPEETARCLDSLLQQDGVTANQLEIILAEGPPHAAISSLSSRFAGKPVRFVRCQGRSLPQLHGGGTVESTAPLVALSEGHCTFARNWAVSAVAAHASCEDSAIGGSVVPGSDLGTINTGLFFCDYAQFLPPFTAAQTCDLPGNNVIFKRDCLAISPELDQQGFWKTFYCKQLYADGKTMHNQPDITVYYNRRLSIDQIAIRRYNHGRCFGGMRANKISVFKRAAYCLTGPILPILLTTRLWERGWSKHQYRKELLSSSAASFLCICLWAAGEWVGNLFGAGESCSSL